MIQVKNYIYMNVVSEGTRDECQVFPIPYVRVVSFIRNKIKLDMLSQQYILCVIDLCSRPVLENAVSEGTRDECQVFPIPYVRVVSQLYRGSQMEGISKQKSKIGHVVIVVHFMYDLPVIKLRSRECRIWVYSG